MQGLVALVVLSLGAGMLARRSKRFPPQTAEAVNALVLNVALPALVLRSMHRVALEWSLVAAAGMLWLQFLLAAVLFLLLGRVTRLPRGSVGALVLTAGLSNTAFVGLPLIEATLGKGALGAAVFVDQAGSFLVVATLGLAFAAALSGRKLTPRAVVTRLLAFPAFLALIAAFALRGFAFPLWLDATLLRLGELLTPLALFSVGFQLRLGGVRERLGPLSLGLGYKLVLSPLLFGALFLLFEDRSSTTWMVTVMQCAMPPMVTGGILAAQHDLDPPLAAAMVGVGLPLSAISVAALIAWLG